MACMVHPYDSERSLLLQSFGWQWRWRQLSYSFGPLPAAGYTPEDKRFEPSAYLWSTEILTKDKDTVFETSHNDYVFDVYVEQLNPLV